MPTTNKQARMYKAIYEHGEKLNKIFNTGLLPVDLCKKLRRMQDPIQHRAEDYCNGSITLEDWVKISEAVLVKLDKLLNFKAKGIHVFINGDPRGYVFKIEDQDMRDRDLDLYRDWGGYGILAPDFREGV